VNVVAPPGDAVQPGLLRGGLCSSGVSVQRRLQPPGVQGDLHGQRTHQPHDQGRAPDQAGRAAARHAVRNHDPHRGRVEMSLFFKALFLSMKIQ